jgi:hypothetical protein
MLNRPEPTDKERRRAINRQRVREHRARRRAGLALHEVTVDSSVYDLLVATRYLTEAELGDKKRLDAALSEMLIDAAKNCNRVTPILGSRP